VAFVIYLDNAATTPIHPKAREAMLPYLQEIFANPSSVYNPARQVRNAIDEARKITAEAINANSAEIFFTASGTESDNWAIKGALEANAAKKHIITSSVEHPGIFHLCEYLSTKGYEITFLPVDEYGFVSPQDVENAIRPDTCIVSVMLANNEVGTIQPISEISKITRKCKVLLHTDAVQAIGHMPVNVNDLGVDLLTLSAHKFYGPKGIGALYVKKGTTIAPLFHGGMQERGRRAGTENVIGIIGMGAALSAALAELPKEQPRLTQLRDQLIKSIQEKISHTKLNGPTGHNRLAGNVNISFRFIEGESLLLHLDMQNCYASTGSACSSGSLDPSHVLMAMGLTHELANGAIRFSLGRENTNEDIDKLMEILQPTVKKLRDLSPLYDDYLRKK
jgi:cysteine desulfurase